MLLYVLHCPTLSNLEKMVFKETSEFPVLLVAKWKLVNSGSFYTVRSEPISASNVGNETVEQVSGTK
jgi:hypothetical protein